MLLWLVLLGGWSSVFALFMPRGKLTSAALAVLAVLSCGFLSYIIGVSNPFARLFPAPPDGSDLNPLLQDPGLIFHPPVLYMGYVGLAVPFALAVASLLVATPQRPPDTTWARLARPWNLMAWLWLGAGIAAGPGETCQRVSTGNQPRGCTNSANASPGRPPARKRCART